MHHSLIHVIQQHNILPFASQLRAGCPDMMEANSLLALGPVYFPPWQSCEVHWHEESQAKAQLLIIIQ